MRDELTAEGADTFRFLTNWEFDCGLLGLADYEERFHVLSWLLKRDERTGGGGSSNDPRGDVPGAVDSPRSEAQVERSEQKISREEPTGGGAAQPGAAGQMPDENPPLQLLPHGLRHRWCFTKNDDDFYPSVPHGHLNDKSNPWPKLNPYSGRAFAAKDREDPQYRLQRWEMIKLWNDRKFRIHALETIVWYQENHPYYRFPVAHPLRLPRWR